MQLDLESDISRNLFLVSRVDIVDTCLATEDDECILTEDGDSGIKV